jgi:hypothetical protein
MTEKACRTISQSGEFDADQRRPIVRQQTLHAPFFEKCCADLL